MLNFIICDDDKSLVEEITNIIDTCMMNNDIDYKKHIYNDYNKDFLKIVKEKIPLKIYILDIVTPSASGIDIARQIRNDDLNSIIIFLTGHNELGDVILQNDLLFLSFINKFDNRHQRLIDAINKSLKIIGTRQVLNFIDNNIVYTISLDNIYYIYKNKMERKIIIVTDYEKFVIKKTLKEIMNELTDDFAFTHKSCIVNKTKVIAIDKTKKEIIFDNGTTINLVSRKCMHEY